MTARRPLIASLDSDQRRHHASTYFAVQATVRRCGDRDLPSSLLYQAKEIGERFGQRAAAVDQRQAVGGTQLRERRQLDHVGEAVRERRIERQRALVGVVRIGIRCDRRVHRRPSVAELRQRQALHALLVDHREELVLRLGAAARDLVEEHALRIPKVARRAEILHATALDVRHRVAEQIVEADEARVVMPVLEPERGGEAIEQLRLRRAVRSDQEQRALVRQRGEHDRVEEVETEEIEAAHQPERAVARRMGRAHDAKLHEFAPRLAVLFSVARKWG